MVTPSASTETTACTICLAALDTQGNEDPYRPQNSAFEIQGQRVGPLAYRNEFGRLQLCNNSTRTLKAAGDRFAITNSG